LEKVVKPVKVLPELFGSGLKEEMQEKSKNYLTKVSTLYKL
jgi:hypothetical protein